MRPRGPRPGGGTKGGRSRAEPWLPPQGVVWSNHPPQQKLATNYHTNKNTTNSTTTAQTEPQGTTTSVPSAVRRVSHGGVASCGDRNSPQGDQEQQQPRARNTARGLRSEAATSKRQQQRSIKRWAARRGKREKKIEAPQGPPQGRLRKHQGTTQPSSNCQETVHCA